MKASAHSRFTLKCQRDQAVSETLSELFAAIATTLTRLRVQGITLLAAHFDNFSQDFTVSLNRLLLLVVHIAYRSHHYQHHAIIKTKKAREGAPRLKLALEAHVGQTLSANALQVEGLYFGMGENDNGFEWLKEFYARKEFELMCLRIDDMFGGVQGRPKIPESSEKSWTGLARHHTQRFQKTQGI